MTILTEIRSAVIAATSGSVLIAQGKLKYYWRVNLITVAIVFTNVSFAVYKSLMLFTMFTDMTCITKKIIRRKF